MAATKTTITSKTGAGNVGSAIADQPKPADIAGATEFDPSGAPIQKWDQIDVDHPAVDNNPRAGTTFDQNRIDFNDPTKTGSEAVADNLREQGQAVGADTSDEK